MNEVSLWYYYQMKKEKKREVESSSISDDRNGCDEMFRERSDQ